MIKGNGYGITAENFYQHELIGLSVSIIGSSDAKRIGTKGVVVDETQNTFVLINKDKKIVVPKKECVFEFDLGNEKVVLEGKKVLKRPEDRLK